jgi:hypothetical protein
VKTYLARLAEQAAVAAGGAFMAAWAASGYSLTQAALGAALGAAIRAAYGVAARLVGDSTQPSVK